VLLLLLALGGCAATRPVNPPLAHVDLDSGYTYQARLKQSRGKDNLVILAFSGGGTRAAAFSYGVLEVLRRTEVVGPDGRYLGPILVERLRGHVPDHRRLRHTAARELVDHSVPRVKEDTATSELAALFARVGVDRLPVVDAGGGLVGTVGKSELLSKGLF
jgi:CBS domain-containing protein